MAGAESSLIDPLSHWRVAKLLFINDVLNTFWTGSGSQQCVVASPCVWHHGALGAPDGLPSAHHRHCHRDRVPEALSAASRLQRHTRVTLQVRNTLVFCQASAGTVFCRVKWNTLPPLAMSGWFLWGGWGPTRSREMFGGWRKNKVCSYMKYIHIICEAVKLTQVSLLSGVNPEMRSSASWILANINVTGYYRVNYDLENWERLLSQLHSKHQVNCWTHNNSVRRLFDECHVRDRSYLSLTEPSSWMTCVI